MLKSNHFDGKETAEQEYGKKSSQNDKEYYDQYKTKLMDEIEAFYTKLKSDNSSRDFFDWFHKAAYYTSVVGGVAIATVAVVDNPVLLVPIITEAVRRTNY